MALENIILEHEKGIATLYINRPEKLNALNKATIQELHETLELVDNNPDIRVIIITGSGEKAFVAGADISEFAHFSAEEGSKLAAQGQKILFDFIENMNTPVIAAINGFALGGGLELAMASHIRLASTNARMGLPEVSLGVIPGYGGTQRLPRLVGRGKATELIVTAGRLSAADALQWGLVNHGVELDALMQFTTDLAGKIEKLSPSAISSALRAVQAGFDSEVIGLKAEAEEFGKCFGTEDFKEGTTAFMEKRKPTFTGK